MPIQLIQLEEYLRDSIWDINPIEAINGFIKLMKEDQNEFSIVSNEEAKDAFCKWISKSGTVVPFKEGLCIETIPDKGNGLITRKTIEYDECVVIIPRDLMLSAKFGPAITASYSEHQSNLLNGPSVLQRVLLQFSDNPALELGTLHCVIEFYLLIYRKLAPF